MVHLRWRGPGLADCRVSEWTIVVMREVSQRVKGLINEPFCVPALTCGHEVWVMKERMSPGTQAAEMSSLRRCIQFTSEVRNLSWE